MSKSQKVKSGAQVFPAKMFPWQERGQELGLKGKDLDSFTNLLNSLAEACPGLSSSKTSRASLLPTKEEILESSYGRWPNSGMAWDGVCLIADTSEYPSRAKESSLLDAIVIGDVPARFFLSPNAARGILRRVESQGRHLFPPLENALRRLAERDPKQS